ncbi:hypothetical protein PG994_003566 [Apiospora phragmitis]|uniref:Uncharacterized protein n=1 Tax=Apiospora phragmitis TaxID=2905665 RepID=A0ABR1W2A6_9PEZI
MAIAAVETCQPLSVGVVWIHRNLIQLLQIPSDSQEPDVEHGTLRALAEIFVRHGAHKAYGLHLRKKEYVLDQTYPGLEIDDNIHGHVYQLTDGAFIPCEYWRGRLDSRFYEVSNALFEESDVYLTVHKLAGLLGLEALDRPQDPNCGEFVLDLHGTAMLEKEDIAGGSSYRKTIILQRW